MQVYTHHPDPGRLMVFVAPKESEPSIIESPNDLGLTQSTLWIREGLGKSHQYYLRGGLWGQKRDRRKPKTSKDDIMRARRV